MGEVQENDAWCEPELDMGLKIHIIVSKASLL